MHIIIPYRAIDVNSIATEKSIFTSDASEKAARQAKNRQKASNSFKGYGAFSYFYGVWITIRKNFARPHITTGSVTGLVV